jgi:hypothetical protein
MALQYSPKIVTDSLVMCLDASQNKSYPTTDLPVKGGLVMWMDAADDTTFSYSSGTTVSQWRDKSGYNYHMVPKVNGPTRSVFLNSRKVLAFTAVQTIGNDVIDLSSTTSTVFVVSRYTSGTNQRVLTCNLDSGGGNWLLGHWGGYVNQYYAEGWVSYQVYGNDTVWRVYMGDYSGPPAGANTDLANIYSNGTAIVTNSTAASGGLRKLGINYYSNETSTCEVAEIIVFNRVLTTPERRLVHTYLGQKWGILNTDRSIVDLSGFNDNGLLGDGTTANMPVYDYYNKGAFRFDGSNDFIKVGPNSSLQVNNVTIAAFFKTVNNGQSVQFIAGYGDTGIAGYWIGTSGGPIRFSIGGGSGNYLQQSSGVTPNNDQIYYVVGTYDGTNQRVYVNGVLQASATTVTGNISYTGLTDGFLVGQVQGFTAGRYLTGSVYNVSVYSRALSQAEISQNYEALKSKFTDAIVQQGLVLNIDAANPYSYGGAGTTVYDTSNTALSWTATNVTYNSDPIKYFSFNGSNSSLVSSTSTAYDSQTITMECWCYPNSLNQLGFLFEKGAVNSQYSMFFSTTNTFYFRTIGGTINNQDLTFTTTTYLTVSAWNHIVCTYNGSSKVIYVNGTQIASVAASGTLQTGQTNQYIGKYGNAGDNYPFNGRIAESRVYNIALTAAQVLQNYNATRTKYGL